MCLCDACLIFQELSFRFTELREVHSESFCGLKNLQILKLDYNKLHTMPELSPIKPTLQKLYLSENQLVRFPNDYFKGFLQLRVLLVNDNHLEAAPSISWLTSTLELLSLENNCITSIAGLYSKTPFQKLSSLYLQDNEINDIDIRILSKMPMLNYLRLDGNRIRHIDDYRPYLARTRINLSLNPFHCDIKMAWMSTVAMNQVMKPTCETPWCIKGKVMPRMSKYSYKKLITTSYRSE